MLKNIYQRFLLPSFRFATQQQQIFSNLTDKQLQTPKFIGNLFETTHMKRKSKKSQRGLFHGKQQKTGKQTCFSEKKSVRTWKPNIKRQQLYSQILERKVKLQCSMKMLKCMRKYGSFDNYILMTKSENMDSMMGEYLKTLMYKKLNNPEFNVPYIYRGRSIENIKKQKMNFKKKTRILHPIKDRNQDLSHLRVKLPEEMGRAEFEHWKFLVDEHEKGVEYDEDHPLLLKVQQERQKQIDILQPDIIAAKNLYLEQCKSRSIREELNKTHAQAVDDNNILKLRANHQKTSVYKSANLKVRNRKLFKALSKSQHKKYGDILDVPPYKPSKQK